jgi:hypothetical protein
MGKTVGYESRRPKEQTAVKSEDDLEEQGLQFVFRFEQ